MVGLIASLFVDGSWQEAGAIKKNVTGTPIVTATPSYDGEAIADVYTITFTGVTPTTSATAHIAASSANPYNGGSGSVNLNASTSYSNLIPGVALVFSNSGSFSSSWTATVTVGLVHGLLNAFPPDSGTATDGTRVQVENTGAADGTSCKARVLNALKAVKITGTVFDVLRGFAPSAVQKLTGTKTEPYAIVVSSVSGSGSSKTMTVKIDGATFSVINLTDFTASSSTGLNVNDYYRAVDSDLIDMEFNLSSAAVNSDKVNVLCFENQFTQIAPDLDGAPGDWAITDVDLTEDGQATGTITPSGLAYFWVRVLVPDGGNSQSNPYVSDVCLEGSAVVAAGWTD